MANAALHYVLRSIKLLKNESPLVVKSPWRKTEALCLRSPCVDAPDCLHKLHVIILCCDSHSNHFRSPGALYGSSALSATNFSHCVYSQFNFMSCCSHVKTAKTLLYVRRQQITTSLLPLRKKYITCCRKRPRTFFKKFSRSENQCSEMRHVCCNHCCNRSMQLVVATTAAALCMSKCTSSQSLNPFTIPFVHCQLLILYVMTLPCCSHCNESAMLLL